MRRTFAAVALLIALAVGLMPAIALAADEGPIVVQSDALQPGVAPGRPSGSQITCSPYEVYEEITIISGSGGRTTQRGDYLGPGYKITYTPNSDEAAYINDGNQYFFAVRLVKTPTKPAAPSTSYWDNDDYRSVDGGWYPTGALEPSTTYYVYVATCTVGDTGRTVYGGEYLVWSEWSDPITVKTPAEKKTSLSGANVTLAKASAEYTGKVIKPSVKSVVLGGKTLKAGTDYTVSMEPGKDVGSYKVTVTGKGSYEGTASATFKITKAANKMTKTKVKKTLKAKFLKKKKAATIALPKAKFGKVTWKVTKKDPKKVLAYAKSGKVKVKKGAKKGTYTIKLKANVKGTSNYKALKSKVVTVTMKVM